MTTRAEHMQWCKERARAEVKYARSKGTSGVREGVASMLSDLGKHPDTAGLQEMAAALGLATAMSGDVDGFINGFAE